MQSKMWQAMENGMALQAWPQSGRIDFEGLEVLVPHRLLKPPKLSIYKSINYSIYCQLILGWTPESTRT